MNKRNRKKYLKEYCKRPEVITRRLKGRAERLLKYRNDRQSLKGTVYTMFKNTVNRSKKLNLALDLSPEWIEDKIKGLRWEATGIDLVLEYEEDRTRSPFRPSIDRIDNSKGYTKDNCRIVCFMFNIAKGENTDAEVFSMAKAFVDRYTRKMMEPGI